MGEAWEAVLALPVQVHCPQLGGDLGTLGSDPPPGFGDDRLSSPTTGGSEHHTERWGPSCVPLTSEETELQHPVTTSLHHQDSFSAVGVLRAPQGGES